MTLEEMTKQSSSILVVVLKPGDATQRTFRVEQTIKGQAPYGELTIRSPDGQGRTLRYQSVEPVTIEEKKPVIVFLRFVLPSAMPAATPGRPSGQYFLFCENAWESITQQEKIRAILRQK